MITEKIKILFDSYAQTQAFSGAGLVKSGDTILFEGAYGLAHKGFRVANTPDTRFDTASITKTFTAVATLQLVEKGLFSLNDSIIQILGLQGTKIPQEVTLYHLLTHTSGIADDADEEAGEDYEDLFREKPNYSIRETRDLLAQFAYKDPLFAPGERCRYNNCAFVLLGLAIEKVTGMRYREYVTQHIFERAGMRKTAFCAMDGIHENVAEGYVAIEDDRGIVTGWRKNIYSYPPIGSPDGGACSSVGDLDIFLRALKGGKLLSSELTAQIMQPYVIASETPEGKKWYGYGFGFLIGHDNRVISMYKEGINAGVISMLAYYPQFDTTSIILANQTCNAWSLHRDIKGLLFSSSNP